jgi:hypothetical protein
MIVALLNQKGGVCIAPCRRMGSAGETSHSHRCRPARLGPRLVRTARKGMLAAAVRHCRSGARHAPPRGARDRARRRPCRHRRAAPRRLALLAADLVLVPALPSPFDGWASGEMLRLIDEARIFHPELVARFVVNRCGARTVIARETAAALADHDPPVLTSSIGQRVCFADAARSGRLVTELGEDSLAAREIAASAAEVERIAR